MTPLVLYQRALDAVSAAVLANDFAAYLACIDLPYLVRTTRAQFVLTTAAELEPTFRTLSGTLARSGVTHYERVAREAGLVHPDRIEGWHHTHMIANGERIIAPHPARQALVRRGDRWLFSEAGYPLQTAQWPLSEAAVLGPKATEVPAPGRLLSQDGQGAPR
jgi:hypothetical protein